MRRRYRAYPPLPFPHAPSKSLQLILPPIRIIVCFTGAERCRFTHDFKRFLASYVLWLTSHLRFFHGISKGCMLSAIWHFSSLHIGRRFMHRPMVSSGRKGRKSSMTWVPLRPRPAVDSFRVVQCDSRADVVPCLFVWPAVWMSKGCPYSAARIGILSNAEGTKKKKNWASRWHIRVSGTAIVHYNTDK